MKSVAGWELLTENLSKLSFPFSQSLNVLCYKARILSCDVSCDVSFDSTTMLSHTCGHYMDCHTTCLIRQRQGRKARKICFLAFWTLGHSVLNKLCVSRDGPRLNRNILSWLNYKQFKKLYTTNIYWIVHLSNVRSRDNPDNQIIIRRYSRL